MRYEYKIVGPSENLSAGPVKCHVCQGNGKRIASPGSIPEVCAKCEGTGSYHGLLAQVNEAAAEGWRVVASHGVGQPATNHVFVMEREVAEVAQQEAVS
jgi:hypothetical protein